MQNKAFSFLNFILAIFLIGLVSATNASSSTYNIEKFNTGVSGSNASSNSYSFVTTASSQAGNNFSSTSYQGSSDPFTNANTSSSSGSDSGSGSAAVGSGSSGGGGGSGSSDSVVASPKIAKGFSVDPGQISALLSQGEVRTESFTVTNKKGTKIDFTIKNQISGGLVVVEEKEFTLNPGESKEIIVDFIAKEDTKPTLYLGKIIINGGGNEQAEILIALSVESKGALLDVRIEIQKKYQKVLPGDEILANINMFNFGLSKRADINLKYTISDFDGNVFFTKNETLAIETQTSFVAFILLPNDIPKGAYILYVEASYEGKVAGATANFEIVSNKVTQNEKVFIAIIIILIMLLSLGIQYYLKEKYPKEKFKSKVDLASLMGRK